MNPKLHSNRELNDYTLNDSFNFLTKADAIKIFLEQNPASLEQNKMIVLYGDWGSGKTSLMRHIESTIEPIYKTIFFQAWEHEKDENLALSLCDSITSCLQDKASKLVKEFMKGALLTLKSFASGVTFKSSSLLSGLGIDLEISGEKIVKEINDAIDNSKHPSFYSTNNAFKEKFIEVENTLLKQANAQKLLIFIDDLDRCEPENVLNLITALKLFFTYGKNSVFFCGIDKEAVTKAVKTKYKDVIKSEEYMEKVFDISFSMPKTFSLTKLLEPYFPGETTLNNGQHIKSALLIESFFNSIRFTNPRHVKKVLNKYEIIKSFKVLSTISEDIRKLIPDIISEENEGNTFETIYCLFFIILYEFHFDYFVELEAYEEKMEKYIEPLLTYAKNTNGDNNQANLSNTFRSRYIVDNYKQTSLKFLLDTRPISGLSFQYFKFLFMFSHSNPPHLALLDERDLEAYGRSFNDKSILTLYCKFLIKHKEEITLSATDYPIWNLFEMVKYLL